jgi:hypothetical protein
MSAAHPAPRPRGHRRAPVFPGHRMRIRDPDPRSSGRAPPPPRARYPPTGRVRLLRVDAAAECGESGTRQGAGRTAAGARTPPCRHASEHDPAVKRKELEPLAINPPVPRVSPIGSAPPARTRHTGTATPRPPHLSPARRHAHVCMRNS